MENLEKKMAAAEVAMLKCEQENQAKLARSEESRVKDTRHPAIRGEKAQGA